MDGKAYSTKAIIFCYLVTSLYWNEYGQSLPLTKDMKLCSFPITILPLLLISLPFYFAF